MRKILIAEDEKDICEILRFNLSSEYDINTVFSAEEALKKELKSFDLFLFDVMMEEMSGFQLADKIRNELKIQTPIIFLTAKDSENDMLTGFNIGADDYIKKPFSINEVKVRIKAVLKRNFNPKSETGKNKLLVFDKLMIDILNKQVFISDKEIKLTKKEFEILSLLTGNPNKMFSRNDIIDLVWDREASFVNDRTVDVHVARLRSKLDKYKTHITNRVGYGYKFNFDENNR